MLMVEVFKIVNGFVPPTMEDFFLFRENTHNIQNFQIISNASKKTVRYGLETMKYRTPLLLPDLPGKCKTTTSLNSFKIKIKTWKCETWVCRLCQTYHQNLVLAFQPVSAQFYIFIPPKNIRKCNNELK